MKSITLILGLFFGLLFILVSCNSDSTKSTSPNQSGESARIEQSVSEESIESKNSQDSNLEEAMDSIDIKNFGMNKGKTIWVNANNITKTTHIRLDGILLESNARVAKGVVLAQLPDSFSGKRKVIIELVDMASNNTSNQKNGLLSVEEVYLLKLKD